ncbi:MAG: PD-(D/E)XK nuclease domain-containing protein, partial [bacterium]
VRRAMTGQVMEFIGHVAQTKFGSFIPKFRNAIETDDIGLFCQHLQDFFTLIPHTVIVNREMFYQGTFYMICRLFGGEPLAEVATHMGFIDVKLESSQCIYIIEFKKDKKPDIALAQIENKGYAQASKIESTKPIILVGISCSSTKSGVTVKYKSKNA